MSSYCGVCGTEADHTESFCTACGAEIEAPAKGSTTNQPTGQPYAAKKPAKRLYRCCCDTVAGGVCAGLAEYVDMDVHVVRLLVVIATLITSGTVAIAYIVLWAVLPIEPVEMHNSRPIKQPVAQRQRI